MDHAGDSVRLFGVTLIGCTPENGRKLLLTLGFAARVFVVGALLRLLLRNAGTVTRSDRVRFWARHAVSILPALLLIAGVISIWFDDPTRLTKALGLVTAGLAFALQRVITATAGCLLILRGKTFNVGDRIVMGGVRGDVIALSFMRTKIMEMGEPPAVDSAAPAMWVHCRQFTGRIVTVTNDEVFDEPVCNFTYHFPYIWEEMRLPIRYPDDRQTAERLLLEAAERHAVTSDRLPQEQLREFDQRYKIRPEDIPPRVYWRLTDNWIELTVRFLAPDHGVREIKDAMSRDILAGLDQAGIDIASATCEITAVPPIQLARAGRS